MSGYGYVQAQWREVAAQVAAAAERAGRAPASVRLVAVSKTHPAEAVLAAFEAGAREFGENRVEELAPKRAAVEAALGAEAASIRWHLIGQLQSRKIRELPPLALVHTVDRASQLQAFAKRGGPIQPVLIEVNVGGEPQKGGVALADLEALARQVEAAPTLELRGLMTIPPVRDNPADAAADFRALRSALAQLRDTLPPEAAARCVELSMGMSADYPQAIAEGATLVRIGTAIFGARSTP